MKRYLLLHIILLFVLLFIRCDSRRIYKKGELTDRTIIKQLKDTIIIKDERLLTLFIKSQTNNKSENHKSYESVDSIIQTNYWLRIENDELIKTEKRLNKIHSTYEKGRLIYQATYQNDGDMYLSNRYFYDDAGLLLGRQETNSARNLIEQQLVYSKDNLIVEIAHNKGKDKMSALSTFSYNASDKTYTELIDWLDSETKSKIVKYLDDSGNVVREQFHEALMNKQLTDTTEKVVLYEYDKQNRLVTKYLHNTWGMTLKYEDALYSVTTYSYDGNGNIKEMKETKRDGSPLTAYFFEYEYDSKNNWIVKTSYKNGQPESKLIREYFYH